MTELPPPSRHRRVVAQEALPSNYVRKPNPVTGFIDRHKKLGIIVVVAAIALIIGVAAATGSTKKSPSSPSTPSSETYCDVLNSEAKKVNSNAFIELVVPGIMKGYSPEKQAAMRADVAAHCPQWTFAVNP